MTQKQDLDYLLKKVGEKCNVVIRAHIPQALYDEFKVHINSDLVQIPRIKSISDLNMYLHGLEKGCRLKSK